MRELRTHSSLDNLSSFTKFGPQNYITTIMLLSRLYFNLRSRWQEPSSVTLRKESPAVKNKWNFIVLWLLTVQIFPSRGWTFSSPFVIVCMRNWTCNHAFVLHHAWQFNILKTQISFSSGKLKTPIGNCLYLYSELFCVYKLTVLPNVGPIPVQIPPTYCYSVLIGYMFKAQGN